MLSNGSFSKFFWQSLNTSDSELALVDSTRSLSYSVLQTEVARIADKLRGKKVKSGEPIGCIVSNQAVDVVNYLAIWSTGGVVVPIHVKAATQTLHDIIERTGMRLILKGDSEVDWPQALEGYTPDGDICITKQGSFLHSSSLSEAALIVFTSGSTGIPKGVILTHEALNGKLNAINKVIPFSAGDSTLLVLHLTFSYGIWVSFLTLKQGGTLHMLNKFNPNIFLTYLTNHDISTVAVTPTMIRMLFNQIDETTLERFSEKQFEHRYPKLLITGGELLTTQLGEKFNHLFPFSNKADVYGLTETCTSDFILTPSNFDAFYGTIGKASPDIEYRICDENGERVKNGSVGELEIKSPYVMRGYLGQDDLTKQCFHDNYFSTGDLAKEHENGIVEIVGRKKELIYKGGNKISPIEIENAFSKHPNIKQCIVVSIPDEIMQEKIAMLLIGENKSELEPLQLKNWATQYLEKHKIPDMFYFVESIPVGSTGKACRKSAKEYILNLNM